MLFYILPSKRKSRNFSIVHHGTIVLHYGSCLLDLYFESCKMIRFSFQDSHRSSHPIDSCTIQRSGGSCQGVNINTAISTGSAILCNYAISKPIDFSMLVKFWKIKNFSKKSKKVLETLMPSQKIFLKFFCWNFLTMYNFTAYSSVFFV